MKSHAIIRFIAQNLLPWLHWQLIFRRNQVKLFYSMFLLNYFLFLDKTYNNQNQDGFIIMSEAATRGVP